MYSKVKVIFIYALNKFVSICSPVTLLYVELSISDNNIFGYRPNAAEPLEPCK